MFDALIEDCLFELPTIIRGKKLTDVAPYRRVATAIGEGLNLLEN